MNPSIVIRSHPVFQEVEVLRGQTMQHSYPRHFHDTFGIGILHSGIELCWNRGAERVFQGGDLALFNAGDVHDGRPGGPEGWTYDMLYFPAAMLGALLGSTDCWFESVSVRHPDSYRLARRVACASHDGDVGSAEEGLVELLARVMSSRHRPEVDPVAATRVREFIDDEVSSEISIKRLAIVSGTSPEHVVRSFRKRYGITPHAYHQARRVENARLLLRATCPLAEIALGLGFSDQSHFSRWFRKIQGLTPSAYRSGLQT